MLAEPTKKKFITAESLSQKPPKERRGELVRGEFVAMSPAGFIHGRIALKIGTYINMFVINNQLGEAYAAETGFILTRDPDTVRAPDVAFVTAERVAQHTVVQGFFQGAPDLAVEVISPTETINDIEDKLIDYLEAGTRLVWLIYPRTKTITVYRSLTNIETLTVADVLSGDEVLPGFTISVAEIFT